MLTECRDCLSGKSCIGTGVQRRAYNLLLEQESYVTWNLSVNTFVSPFPALCVDLIMISSTLSLLPWHASLSASFPAS
jgi:hypothetical protein